MQLPRHFVLVVRWCAAVALSLSLTSVHAATLRVAAAADLTACMTELNAAFTGQHADAPVISSTGSSGNFFAQIKNGAPFDVFLSADLDYPRELIHAGLADATTLMVYAHGQLVLFAGDPSLPIAEGFALLDDARVKKIAIANPAVAPYGRAARAALQHAGVWSALKPKLVFGDNVAQAAQFVTTGNAQLGLVGIAQVGPSSESVQKNRYWVVPTDWYPLMEQGGIVTAHGRGNPLASQYLLFLQSEAGRVILRKFGFAVPASAS